MVRNNEFGSLGAVCGNQWHFRVLCVEGPDALQAFGIGIHVVKEDAHDGVGHEALCDGSDVPKCIGDEKHRALLGLNKGAMLTLGVPRQREHHDAAIPKQIPALAQFWMDEHGTRFESLAGLSPIVGEEFFEHTFCPASPVRQFIELLEAFFGGPARGVLKITHSTDMVSMNVRAYEVLDFVGVDLSMRLVFRSDGDFGEQRINALGEVLCRIEEARGVPRVEQNCSVLGVVQLGPNGFKPNRCFWRTMDDVMTRGKAVP